MSKRYAPILKNQAKVAVLAPVYRQPQAGAIWLLTVGAIAAASLVYLFSFFFSFSFTGGRAPAGY